ncbi:hypothetical protein JW964_04740 [candidate division KSB1 bacterium]|nr:hypothetical protein [candidate division KSB1 bacterium]
MESPVEQKVEPIYGLRSYFILGLGLIVLVVGYYFLAQPASDPGKPAAEGFLSLNVAPILLFIAYLIIIPVALLLKRPKKTEERNE